MLFFPFIAAAAGLPLLGGQAVATQKYKSIRKVAEAAYSQLDITLLVVRFFLIFILFLVTFWLVFKLRSIWGNWRVKRVGELLYRLETEIILLEEVKSFSDKEKVFLSKLGKETIQMLIERLNRRSYFAKRLGKQHREMMVDSLKLMLKDKFKSGEKLVLIRHWAKITEVFQSK